MHYKKIGSIGSIGKQILKRDYKKLSQSWIGQYVKPKLNDKFKASYTEIKRLRNETQALGPKSIS